MDDADYRHPPTPRHEKNRGIQKVRDGAERATKAGRRAHAAHVSVLRPVVPSGSQPGP